MTGKLDNFRSGLRIRFARQTPKNPHSRGLLNVVAIKTEKSFGLDASSLLRDVIG
jgi:hypothetical protein